MNLIAKPKEAIACNKNVLLFRFVILFCSGNEKRVYPNILHAIGSTPMVKLNKIHKEAGLKCDVCK